MYLRAFRTYKSVHMYSCITVQSELTSQLLCTHVSQSNQNVQVSDCVLMHTCTQACTGTRSRSRSHYHSHSRSRSHSRSCSCCFVDSTCHQPVMTASSLQELAAMRYLATCELDKRRHLVTDVRTSKRHLD